jgi:uncharacterized membrane protein
MSWPNIDMTVTVGNILTAAAFALSGIGIYTGTMIRLNEHELRIQLVEEQKRDLKQLALDVSLLQRDVAVIRDRIERGGIAR